MGRGTENKIDRIDRDTVKSSAFRGVSKEIRRISAVRESLMAFTMTHLIISKNISEAFESRIGNLPQFYLGTIAPDAVHNRADYSPDFKKASHLYAGPERWGMITNHGEWINSVITFFNERKNSGDRDFIIGYCTHVLTDIYNNKNEWIPFKERYPGEIEKGYGNRHHQESGRIDIELALTYDGREMFRQYLAASRSIDLPEIIYAGEMNEQVNNILNLWYKDKKRPDIASNTIVTYESNMDFIKEASGFAADVLRELLL